MNGLGLELGVGALGGGAFLFFVKKWMTSSDSRHTQKKTPPHSLPRTRDDDVKRIGGRGNDV